jgi:hypothetical protein
VKQYALPKFLTKTLEGSAKLQIKRKIYAMAAMPEQQYDVKKTNQTQVGVTENQF